MNKREREQRFDARVTAMFERLYDAAVAVEITAEGGWGLPPEEFDQVITVAQDRVSTEAISNLAIEMILEEDYHLKATRRANADAHACWPNS